MFLNGFSQKTKIIIKLKEETKRNTFPVCLTHLSFCTNKFLEKVLKLTAAAYQKLDRSNEQRNVLFFFFDFLFTQVWQTKMVSSVCVGGGGCVLRSFINARDRVMMMMAERGTVAQYLRPCPPYSRTLPGPKRTGWLAAGKLALAIEVSDTHRFLM